MTPHAFRVGSAWISLGKCRRIRDFAVEKLDKHGFSQAVKVSIN